MYSGWIEHMLWMWYAKNEGLPSDRIKLIGMTSEMGLDLHVPNSEVNDRATVILNWRYPFHKRQPSMPPITQTKSDVCTTFCSKINMILSAMLLQQTNIFNIQLPGFCAADTKHLIFTLAWKHFKLGILYLPFLHGKPGYNWQLELKSRHTASLLEYYLC